MKLELMSLDGKTLFGNDLFQINEDMDAARVLTMRQRAGVCCVQELPFVVLMFSSSSNSNFLMYLMYLTFAELV